MYGPAQSMHMALNRRLQRQQMEQSGEIADQNNAMQLLSQGQDAMQGDAARDAALERLKEQAGATIMRAQLGADAKVQGAEAAADARARSAERAAQAREFAADAGLTGRLDYNQVLRENAVTTGKSRVDAARARPAPGKGNQRPTDEVSDLQKQKALQSRIGKLEADARKLMSDWKTKAIDDATYRSSQAAMEQQYTELSSQLEAVDKRLSGKK